MPLMTDLYDWMDNAGITVDVDKIQAVTLDYKQTTKGKVATFAIEMKPDAVPFPEGLKETKLTWRMES